MPDALSGYHSADPWPHMTARREARVDDLVDAQQLAARLIRGALTEAHQRIARVTAPLDWPARGYDQAVMLAKLMDMCPTQTPAEMDGRAWEIAQEEMS